MKKLAPAAIGIIFSKDQQSVLLVKRKDIPMWVLPGGGIETNETAIEAVQREIQEETGLKVQVKRQSGYYTPLNSLSAPASVFVCSIEGGELLTLTDETANANFYPLYQLPATFFMLHQEWLQDALSSPNLIEKPINGVTYKAVFKYFINHPWLFLRYLWTRFTNN